MNIEEMKNQIYCCDCLDFMKQLPDKCIDLVLTDPPYKIETRGGGIALNDDKRYLRGLEVIGVSIDYDLFGDNIFLVECSRVLKNINIFIFCNKRQIYDILSYAEERKYNYEIIPLLKTSPVPFCNNQWLPDREWGIHIFKNMNVYGNYTTKRGFFFDSTYKDENIKHPTPKPVDLVKKIICNLTCENDIVLDVFGGSFSTAIACIRAKRIYTCCDNNIEYVEDGRKRIAAEHEKTALFNPHQPKIKQMELNYDMQDMQKRV